MKITKMMKKFVSGVLVGMTALVGFAPLPVFAQGKEAECICEEKCTEDCINAYCCGMQRISFDGGRAYRS